MKQFLSKPYKLEFHKKKKKSDTEKSSGEKQQGSH